MKHSITKLMLLLAVVLCSIGANAISKRNHWSKYANTLFERGYLIEANGMTIVGALSTDSWTIDIIDVLDYIIEKETLIINGAAYKKTDTSNWGGENIVNGRPTTFRFPEYIVIDGYKYTVRMGETDAVFFSSKNPVDLIFEGPVTICASALSDCSNIKSITMPLNSEIREGAFSNCTSLQTVNFTAPTANTDMYLAPRAFAGCTKLSTLTFPESSTKPYISAYAFEGCTALTSLTLPNATVKKDAFAGCTNLESLTIKMTGTLFYDFYSFEGMTSLRSVSLSGTKFIDNGAFKNCVNLTTVTGASSIQTIGVNAFENCTSLTSISTFQLAKIYEGAFKNCSALTYCGGKGSYALNFIGNSAFEGCKSLTGQFILDNCTNIGERAFAGCTDPDLQLTGVNLNACGSLAFYNCAGTLSTESTSTGTCGINNSPFYGSLFTTITANKLTSVSDNYYFNNMPMLETINCQKLTSINPNWFAACPLLKSINVNNNNLRSSGTPTNGYAIYNGDYTTLLYAPQGVSRVVVDSRCNFVDATKFGRCIKQINAKGQVITFCPVQTLDFSNTDQEVTLYNPESSTLLPPTIKIPYGKRDLFASFTSDEVRVGEALEPIGVITDYIKGDVDEDGKVTIADANAAVNISLGQ